MSFYFYMSLMSSSTLRILASKSTPFSWLRTMTGSISPSVIFCISVLVFLIAMRTVLSSSLRSFMRLLLVLGGAEKMSRILTVCCSLAVLKRDLLRSLSTCYPMLLISRLRSPTLSLKVLASCILDIFYFTFRQESSKVLPYDASC